MASQAFSSRVKRKQQGAERFQIQAYVQAYNPIPSTAHTPAIPAESARWAPDVTPSQESIAEDQRSDSTQISLPSFTRRSLRQELTRPTIGPRLSGQDMARAYLRICSERLAADHMLLRAKSADQAQKIKSMQLQLAASEQIVEDKDHCIRRLQTEIDILGGVARGRWRNRQEVRAKLTAVMVRESDAQSEGDRLRAQLIENDKKMREMQAELDELAAALKTRKAGKAGKAGE